RSPYRQMCGCPDSLFGECFSWLDRVEPQKGPFSLVLAVRPAGPRMRGRSSPQQVGARPRGKSLLTAKADCYACEPPVLMSKAHHAASPGGESSRIAPFNSKNPTEPRELGCMY